MTLVCKVELSQTKGLTLTVLNKSGSVTQTAVFDGTSMIFTCKGKDATSVITQTSDSITVDCQNFNVNADTITCKSKKNTTHDAQGTFTINSTGNSSFTSSADTSLSATSNLTMSAADCSTTAKNTAQLTSMTTTVNGTQQTNLTGAELAMSATSSASLKGATISIAAQTTMSVEGLTTTVKGSTTAIQGSLVTLG